MTTTQATGPLAGYRVIDMTAVVLGPLATQILGDYGADVIKIEGPEGDMVRAGGAARSRGMGSIFMNINRNKRSVAIDLKTPEGVEALRRLIATADVLVHNMRVAAIERLGFGYEAVAAINPRIVYCAATGFGQSGPHRDKPAFDDIIQAGCGLVGVSSLGRDEPDYVPTLVADRILHVGGVSLSLVSIITALLGVALMAALWALLTYTKLGVAMRAVAQREDVAEAMGLPVRTVLMAAWAAAAVLATAAALLFAPTTLLNPNMMLDPLSKGFVAAVIGGTLADFVLEPAMRTEGCATTSLRAPDRWPGACLPASGGIANRTACSCAVGRPAAWPSGR